MLRDESTLHRARRVSTALTDLASPASSCPVTADRFDWSSDTLDELARAVSAFGDVVETLTGGPDEEISRLTADLVTTIVRRRNELLRNAPPTRSRLHR